MVQRPTEAGANDLRKLSIVDDLIMVQNSQIIRHLISRYPISSGMCERVSEQTNEHSGESEQSE